MIQRMILFATVLTVGWLLPAAATAQWEPVTEDDWRAVKDTTSLSLGAEMIFERVFVDDSGGHTPKTWKMNIYRRIRILKSEGRHWGDVKLPHFHKNQDIKRIEGRTILRNGRAIPLEKNQIIESEVLRGKGVKIKQKSFSMPGMTDDCIIEYRAEYKIPGLYPVWTVQQTIRIRHAELRWKYWTQRISILGRMIIGGNPKVDTWLGPQYLWLNTHQADAHNIEFHPAEKPKELIFTMTNVRPFEEEPVAPPDATLLAQVRYYYGKNVFPDEFWREVSNELCKFVDDFSDNNKRVRKVTAALEAPGTDLEKAAAVYAWVHANITNTVFTTETGKKYKDNKHADDVIKRGYGSPGEINLLFYTMLRTMGIKAWMAYGADRGERLFVPEARYWQFDMPMVAVHYGDQYTFYSPGHAFMPAGRVPYNLENTRVFVVNHKQLYIDIPFSPVDENRTRRLFRVRLAEDGKLSGDMTESRTGQDAVSMRAHLIQLPENEREKSVKKWINDLLPNTQVDAIHVDNTDVPDSTLSVNCRVRTPQVTQHLGPRLVVQPFAFLDEADNPFHSETRRHPIQFNYAFEQTETMHLDLPEGWTVEAAPTDTVFTTVTGRYEIHAEQDAGRLILNRSFTIREPYWTAEEYGAVRDLFQARQTLQDVSVVLQKEEGGRER